MSTAAAQPELARLRARLAEIADISRAANLLEWDERVCMPAGGAPVHGEMQSTLRRLAHEQFTSDEVGSALAAAAREVAPDSDEGRLVSVTQHDFDRATRVPASYVSEHAQVISAAQHAWEQARAANSFATFAPHLEKVIALKRQYVTFFPPAAHPYDVVLDDFEPGMTTAEVLSLFSVLRERQVALIRAVGNRPPVNDAFMHASYGEQEMWNFAVDVITRFGFDWTKGRQDKSSHPFASSFGATDVRITTRWVADQPFALLFGTMHETGHALYEQGVSLLHHRTPLEGGASLGVHESQSRLWENLVGRSRAFWGFFFPALQARFPDQLGGVSLDTFYRGINKVQPSLIRVEADEATYNLHVMLRVELEIALLEGKAQVSELPELWRARMKDYLGLEPPTDALGVLQDIHWSAGLFGYFATYTLGNVIAAQLWDTYGAAHPDRDADIAAGNFAPLLAWLRTNLHQYGRAYKPQELVTRITKTRVDPNPYLQYLERKYGEVYGL